MGLVSATTNDDDSVNGRRPRHGRGEEMRDGDKTKDAGGPGREQRIW